MQEAFELMSMSTGAIFRRCDLHVHTPASRDMHTNWAQASPAELVKFALEKQLDVIAVTDHNAVDWCDPVREAAVGSALVVLPGIEISTSEGHLLAIFDRDKATSELWEFLIQIGIRQKDFGNLDAIASLNLTETAKAVEREGGLSIAAHVERERGFLKMAKAGARRREIEALPELRAFEILDAGLREKYGPGSIPGRQGQVACVQGSDCWPPGGDCHHLDAVGTRSCLIKMDDVTVWALRQATLDPELRIHLAGDPTPRPGMTIEGLWLSGGFLGGQMLRFSDDISCLVGGTGSGKSLTIELIRFALDQQVDPVLPRILEEVNELLSFALREMDAVHLLVQLNGQRYVIVRPWMPQDAPSPVVYRVSDKTVEPLEGEPIHVPSFFPIKGYSQSEIIEYAREPLARLSLLDGLIDISGEHDAIVEAKADLRRNATDLLQLEREREHADDQLKDLPGLEEEIQRLSAFLKNPEVRKQEAWQEERAFFDAFGQALRTLGETVAEDMMVFEAQLPSDEELPTEPVNADLLERLGGLRQEVVRTFQDARERLGHAIRELERRLADARAEWDGRFQEADRRYRELVAELGDTAHGQAAILGKLEQLRNRERTLKTLGRRLGKETLPRLQQLKGRREELLTELQEARKAITAKRRKKADQLVKALDGKVAIEVGHADDGREFKKELMELRTGSRVQEQEIDALVDSHEIHPVPLVKLLLAGDFETPAKRAKIPAASLERLYDNIVSKDWLEELYELQVVDLQDVVRVRFAVDEHTYRDLEALAHGQKCTVVLMISLAEGDFPLLVDQPEDALHAPWIESYIVSALRTRRGERQCLFGTRSANVVVSSDAEQVLALKADANRGQVERTGSIDRFSNRDLLMFHVEGGKDAFRRRQLKYGLDFSD